MSPSTPPYPSHLTLNTQDITRNFNKSVPRPPHRERTHTHLDSENMEEPHRALELKSGPHRAPGVERSDVYTHFREESRIAQLWPTQSHKHTHTQRHKHRGQRGANSPGGVMW